jgi:hypothetical protein
MKHELDQVQSGCVAYRPDQLYGWPGIARIDDGEIVAISSERKVHVDPFGRVVIHRSHDGGRSWDLPQEIYNSELDDRDGSVIAMPDGGLVACFFTSVAFMQGARAADATGAEPKYGRRSDRVTQRMIDELVGDWLIRSDDNGRTWDEEPTPLPRGGAHHAGVVLLASGDLATFGYEREGDHEYMYFYRSSDRGDTWTRLGRVPSDMVERTRDNAGKPGGREVRVTAINERTLVELEPDRLLALFRCHPQGAEREKQMDATYEPPPGEEFTIRHLVQCTSDDGGRTWSDGRHLAIYGYPPHVVKLSTGALLCTYSDRRNPKTIRMVFSYDSGETWDTADTAVVDQWPEPAFDMGYPVTVETAPGEILAVYYRHFWPGHPKNFDPAERMGLLFKRFHLR